MFGGHGDQTNTQQDNQGMMQGQAGGSAFGMPIGGQPQQQPQTTVDDAAADMPAPVDDVSTDTSYAQPPREANPSTRAADAAAPDELIGIKQDALQNLRPLIDHLDQVPEEKFRTTMMMIQASDDQSLIPQAYDAAKQISDEKARAQALLDVVNEINYFTAQNTQQ